MYHTSFLLLLFCRVLWYPEVCNTLKNLELSHTLIVSAMVLTATNCLRNGLMKRTLSFIMKFLPVITTNLSLPVTSCSGNCWIWMLCSRTGEKTILGRKSLWVRQESTGSPRVCTEGQSQDKGKSSGPCGQEWGGRTEPPDELQWSWNGQFHLRLVYKKLNNFQWLQN